MSKPLPSATYRAHSKRGDADCAIASMAIIFRRDPEEVLIAAAQVRPTVWRSGLKSDDMMRVARKLGLKVRWKSIIDFEDDIGVLWVSYHHTTDQHCVALIEGLVIEPEHTPASLWDYEEYCQAHNAYGNSLLVVKEK